MIHVYNLAELVRQVILRELSGIFHPQNKEYADTVEIVRYFAKKYNKKVWITYDFEYQVVKFEESLKDVEARKNMK